MGHDFLDGIGNDPYGSGYGKAKSVCSGIFSVQKYDKAAAFGQRMGSGGSPSASGKKEVSASWLRFEMEPCGGKLGLSLPWIPF